MRATEFITEYRNRLLQYVKSLLPTWPEYVLKDWLVPNKGDFSNLPDTELKNGIMEKLQGAGLTPDTKWQLVPDMKFTMDMFDPMTTQRLIGRAGGKSDLGMQIPRDAERHATQAALAQQQGGVRKEPVLLIKTANGYELLEGWHRTIQHFAQYPQGYTGPAYVAVAQSKQGLAEGSEQKMSVQDTLAYLKKVMGTESHEDWRNHIINTNEYFVLKDISVNSLKSDLSGLNKTNVEKYKQMDFSKAPPIVIGSDGNILDGYHRANVAKALKVPTLKAWVGVKKQGVAENFADGKNPVKFTVTTPDGYTHSFQITLAVHGKHVGHFNFVRGADTDDVNNEVEVESRWQGQGYGKLLLMKAIDVANNHGLDFQQDIRGITDAQQNVYDSLENAGSIVTPGDGFWFLTPQGEQELNGLNENFADGKNPGRKGLSRRVGIPKKATLGKLEKIAGSSTGERRRMAQWQLNMRRGKKK
jgi:GNAT superfamily N-acetyltransferase